VAVAGEFAEGYSRVGTFLSFASRQSGDPSE
jgi:hypothetical protein